MSDSIFSVKTLCHAVAGSCVSKSYTDSGRYVAGVLGLILETAFLSL